MENQGKNKEDEGVIVNILLLALCGFFFIIHF